MKRVIKTLHFSEVLRRDFGKRRGKCLIFGNFGEKNLGNETILSGQLDEMKYVQNIESTIVSRFPEEIIKTHEVPAVNLFKLKQVLQNIKKSNFIILGGGEIFKKSNSINDLLPQLYILFYLTYSYFIKKKVYVLSIGYYGQMNSILSSIAMYLLRKASFLSVRDNFTFKYFSVNSVIGKLCKDNSFLMNLLSEKQMMNDGFFKGRYNKKKLNLGIALKKPANKKEAAYISSEIIKFICKNHKDTDFWFYVMNTNKNTGDLEFAQSIFNEADKKILYKHNFHFIPNHWHPRKIFSSFKLMDFCISMSLHSSIFCYRNKVEFIGVSFDKKCASFLESIDVPSYSIQEIDGRYLQKKYKEFKSSPLLRYTRRDISTVKRRSRQKKKRLPIRFFRIGPAVA